MLLISCPASSYILNRTQGGGVIGRRSCSVRSGKKRRKENLVTETYQAVSKFEKVLLGAQLPHMRARTGS